MTHTLSIDDLTPEKEMLESLPDMTDFQRACTMAALGTKIIFRRNDLYLDEMHSWGNSPHGFDWWEADRLQYLFNQWKDKPDSYVYVTGNADLDAVEWQIM